MRSRTLRPSRSSFQTTSNHLGEVGGLPAVVPAAGVLSRSLYLQKSAHILRESAHFSVNRGFDRR
jgi:hypothetical protein